jgi:hypothetical protein
MWDQQEQLELQVMMGLLAQLVFKDRLDRLELLE